MMRLTRRGYGVVGIVVLAEALAFGFGARSLNAIAAPALIALAGAAVQLRLAESPAATRSPVPPGFPGDTREMDVDVEGSGVARITQPLPEELTADRTTELSLPGEFTLEVTCGRRGVYSLDPLDVTVTDLLGLIRNRYTVGGETTVTVYPPVYQLAGRGQILRDALDRRGVERQEFDSLREYVPGDPLRDVHWKTSAKEADTLYVKEFVDRRVDDEVVIVATGDPDCGDAMATAAASVARIALDAGLGVELHVPGGSVPLGQGETHRADLFERLARAEAGTIPADEEPDADVRIHAAADGVEVRFGSQTRSLEELTVSRDNPTTGRAGA